MDDADLGSAPAPRYAWAFAVAFLCLTLPARGAVAAFWMGLPGVAMTAALFVLPLSYTIPRGRAVWARHKSTLLSAQIVLTYVPYVLFGQDWIVGLSGLLGALLLSTLRGPMSWVLFGATLAIDGVLRFYVVGIPGAPGESLTLIVWSFTPAVNMALALFGLVRLADLVTDLHAARTELAALAVARQRLRASSRIREAIGDRLEAVAACARVALAGDREQARAKLVEAAAIARRALDQVRVVVADDDHGPEAAERVGTGMAPRLALFVMATVPCTFTAQLLANVFGSDIAGTAKTGAAAVIVTVTALQFYQTLPRRDGARPHGWVWTLAAQTLLTFGLSRDIGTSLLGLAGFPAGSALTLLPGRWAWTAFAIIESGIAVFVATAPVPDLYDMVYLVCLTGSFGLMLYGLSRLTDLAIQVDAARRELARMAVVRERLRMARDTHDLLGLGLSAIALKCDLIIRLLGRDDARADEELRRLLEISASARADMLAVTGESSRLSLREELASAREVLASAGIGLRTDVPGASLPPAVDAVLAAVLREGVTNVLRHATAERCDVQLSTAGEAIQLRIANDGAAPAEPGGAVGGTGGAGIGNLDIRVRGLGGRLTAGPDGEGRFELSVEIPLGIPPPRRLR